MSPRSMSFQSDLVRLLARGLHDIEEWRLGDPARAAAKGYPKAYPAEIIDDWGIVFVDVTIDAESGLPVCHEVNGPNGVGSDTLTGESGFRAENEVRQTLHRLAERGVRAPFVTIHGHQHWAFFRTAGEIYPRVGLFAEMLSERLPGHEVRLRGGGDALGTEDVAAVVGDVPSVAADLFLDESGRNFIYQGRPVVFIGTPNVFSELMRTEKVDRPSPGADDSHMRVFHAWRLVHLSHDKARQQPFFDGTGIRPLAHFQAWSEDDVLARTREALARGPVVLKPNGTSGGTGIHVVVPEMADVEIEDRIASVIADCGHKYGPNVEAMVFPLRGFEFVRSTGYPMPDGDHMWDLRIAVAFEPGVARTFPVSMRVTPKAFDRSTFHLDRDQWVSNCSGRERSLLKSGLDDEALGAVGVSEEVLHRIMDDCVVWLTKAWDDSVRNGNGSVTVYEDELEAQDPSFHPYENFGAPVA